MAERISNEVVDAKGGETRADAEGGGGNIKISPMSPKDYLASLAKLRKDHDFWNIGGAPEAPENYMDIVSRYLRDFEEDAITRMRPFTHPEDDEQDLDSATSNVKDLLGHVPKSRDDFYAKINAKLSEMLKQAGLDKLPKETQERIDWYAGILYNPNRRTDPSSAEPDDVVKRVEPAPGEYRMPYAAPWLDPSRPEYKITKKFIDTYGVQALETGKWAADYASDEDGSLIQGNLPAPLWYMLPALKNRKAVEDGTFHVSPPNNIPVVIAEDADTAARARPRLKPKSGLNRSGRDVPDPDEILSWKDALGEAVESYGKKFRGVVDEAMRFRTGRNDPGTDNILAVPIDPTVGRFDGEDTLDMYRQSNKWTRDVARNLDRDSGYLMTVQGRRQAGGIPNLADDVVNVRHVDGRGWAVNSAVNPETLDYTPAAIGVRPGKSVQNVGTRRHELRHVANPTPTDDAVYADHNEEAVRGRRSYHWGMLPEFTAAMAGVKRAVAKRYGIIINDRESFDAAMEKMFPEFVAAKSVYDEPDEIKAARRAAVSGERLSVLNGNRQVFTPDPDGKNGYEIRDTWNQDAHHTVRAYEKLTEGLGRNRDPEKYNDIIRARSQAHGIGEDGIELLQHYFNIRNTEPSGGQSNEKEWRRMESILNSTLLPQIVKNNSGRDGAVADAKGGDARAASKGSEKPRESTAPTDEQIAEALEFLEMFRENEKPENEFEANAIERLYNLVSATYEKAIKNRPIEPVEEQPVEEQPVEEQPVEEQPVADEKGGETDPYAFSNLVGLDDLKRHPVGPVITADVGRDNMSDLERARKNSFGRTGYGLSDRVYDSMPKWAQESVAPVLSGAGRGMANVYRALDYPAKLLRPNGQSSGLERLADKIEDRASRFAPTRMSSTQSVLQKAGEIAMLGPLSAAEYAAVLGGSAGAKAYDKEIREGASGASATLGSLVDVGTHGALGYAGTRALETSSRVGIPLFKTKAKDGASGLLENMKRDFGSVKGMRRLLYDVRRRLHEAKLQNN